MLRLYARLAASAEEGFQPLVAKGRDHGNIVSRSLTAINAKRLRWTAGRSTSFVLGGLLRQFVAGRAGNAGVGVCLAAVLGAI